MTKRSRKTPVRRSRKKNRAERRAFAALIGALAGHTLDAQSRLSGVSFGSAPRKRKKSR
jgi:hypothetical protein